MRMKSLVRQATATVLSIELLCALTFAGASLWHEREARLKALDLSLKGRSDSLIGAVQDAEDPLDSVKIDPEEFSPGQHDEFAVYNPNGKLVGASSGDRSALTYENRNGFRNVQANHRHFRVLERDALRIIDRDETGGTGLRRPIKVIYAIPTEHVWHEVMEATRFYLLLSLASVVATAITLIVLAQRLLRPLNELAAIAGSIGPSALHFNPPASALQTRELAPLSRVLTLVVDRLRDAYEAERRFLSDAAHELKTAVAVVKSSIQVLGMRSRSAEEYRGGLDQLLDDNQRVEDLVSRMLILGRVNEGTTQPAVDVEVGDEIRSALDEILTYAETRGVSVEPAIDAHLHARMAAGELKTVISNLVMNAIQHSAHGSTIRVAARAIGARILIMVQDFGTGISADSLPHVFDRFFREDASRSRETGGAGLGLSICKAIVEKAGGGIEIESEKDRGTIAKVRLPRSGSSDESTPLRR
jgi:signal transduction histidine kinase